LTRQVSAFIGGLHHPGTATCENVAPHGGQLSGKFLRAFIGWSTGLDSRGSEDGDAIVLPGRAANPREVVHHVPKSADRPFQECGGSIFIGELDYVALAEGLVLIVHVE
jgi:hypothetical protein